MQQQDILIAGGGIGGLAAALACARAGSSVRLYERSPAFQEYGAGIQLGPNVMRVLRDWGLEPALRDVAAMPERLHVRSARSGAVLGTMNLVESAQPYGAPYFTVHRADLHQVLLKAAQEQAGHGETEAITLRAGCSAQGVTELADAVRLRVDDASGQRQEVEGDMLIGADGLWGHVRRHVIERDHAPRVAGHLAYRIVIRQSELPQALRSQDVTIWLGPGLHVVQYPVRGGEWLNIVALAQGQLLDGLETLQNWDHAGNATDLQARMAEAHACATLRDLISAIPAWRLWVLCDRPPLQGAAEMVKGRVALLGDAAHPMRPYLAQGAGMAIEDAAELGRQLALAGQVGAQVMDAPMILQRYALNRWQRNARVQATALRNGSVFHLSGPVAWARDAAIRVLGERLLDQPWLYGYGQ